MSPPSQVHRAGFVATVGRPNVGKSTLMNAMLDQKLAIVSPKPQTTRVCLHGILSLEQAQVIFVDTPGVCDSGTFLRKTMRRMAGVSVSDSDVTLVVVDVQKGDPEASPEDRRLIRIARESSSRVIVALNKIDRVTNKDQLLPWIQCYAEVEGVEAVVPISALQRDGLDTLRDELIARLPESPPLFPTELITDKPERFLCEELIREQILLQTQQEVPHSAAVVLETFSEESRDTGGIVRLEGRIYLERDSQKGIVIGNRGARIKSISEAARKQIEKLLDCRVYLRLTVHVDTSWTQNEAAVRRFGLVGEG